MSGRIPDDILQIIRDRINIVDLVSNYVSLKKAGRNHLGLCPFHAEKTPSFTVNPERGFFHCFGCGAGGSIFTFLMRLDNLSFPEAIAVLAAKAGVSLPKSEPASPADRERRVLLRLNEVTQEFLRASLQAPGAAGAREYLSRRGLSAATIDQYGIGYCDPNAGGLVRFLGARNAPLAKAAQLGLIGRRDDGSYYDRFRGRVMFPIRDVAGHIVGFGGRTLGTEPPKYLNSPESALFHKGDVLYGLYEARQTIRQADRIVLVEGYMDALALVEAGIGNAVASLGTALTTRQLRLARRFATDVVAFFDGDRAGMDAAARAFSVCAEAGIWGFGAFLPEGYDPDTYVRTYGLAATQTLLGQPISLAEFFVQRNNPGPQATVPERVRAAERIAQVLSLVKDPTQFNMLVRQAAQQLGVGEDVFRTQRAATPGRTSAPAVSDPAAPEPRLRPEEILLLQAVATTSEVANLIDREGVAASLSHPDLVSAATQLVSAWKNADSIGAVVDGLPTYLQQRLSAVMVGGGGEVGPDPLETARQCIRKIEARLQLGRVRELREMIERAEARGDEEASRTAQRQFQAVMQRRSDAGS